MDNLNKVGDKTLDKIKELQQMADNGRGSVMGVIRVNIKHWETELKPACAAVGKNYNQAVLEILKACGYEVDVRSVRTYLDRARKEKNKG